MIRTDLNSHLAVKKIARNTTKYDRYKSDEDHKVGDHEKGDAQDFTVLKILREF